MNNAPHWMNATLKMLQATGRFLDTKHRGVMVAIGLILISLVLYFVLINHDFGTSLLLTIGDMGDYRYVAETFWGRPHVTGFASDWQHYLDSIPFRGIGVGTYYLAMHALVSLFSPTWADSPAIFAVILSSVLKLFLAIPYLVFYVACKRCYGAGMAIFCLVLLVFPVSRWGETQDIHLAEPMLRALFVLSLALLVYIRNARSQFLCAAALWIVFILCAHLKSQWALYPLFLLPPFLIIACHHNASLRRIGLIVVAALAVPLSVLLVNCLVWDDFTLTPGSALHANFKTNGRFMSDVCVNPDPDLAPLCGKKPLIGWWHVYAGTEVPAETFRALDAKSIHYFLQSPRLMVMDFIKGLRAASNYPGESYTRSTIIWLLDMFTWAMLLAGLFRTRMILFSAAGLGLWLIPALGNIFSAYDPRYHAVIGGIPFIYAVLICSHIIRSGKTAGDTKVTPDVQLSPRKAVLLLSGGLDSTTTLAMAKTQGYEVFALSFAYGQRHSHELVAAQKIAAQYGVREHRIITIDLGGFGGSALTEGGIAVPKDRSAEELGGGIPVTYVPARNTIFLSFALAWAEVLKAYDIFIGVNALDYSGYPDCRPEFIKSFEDMANLATAFGVEGGRRIRVHTPLIHLSKAEIIREGLALGVDYAQTTSCYDPDAEGRACGHCDACQLRLKGFSGNAMRDPAIYLP